MILFINTSQTDLIQLKLIAKGKIVRELENHENFKQAELLLKMIDKLFRESRIPRLYSGQVANRDLTAVAVVSGPGAFSALRLGIATVNALAWSLKIPLIELSADEAVSDKKLLDVLKLKTQNSKLPSTSLRTGKAKSFIPIIPKYGREPNITESKKQKIK